MLRRIKTIMADLWWFLTAIPGLFLLIGHALFERDRPENWWDR